MGETMTERPVRVGVFNTVEQARQAVSALLADGFSKDQISVICSDQVKEQFFKAFQHQELPREVIPTGAAAGGTAGAILAGLATLAGIATTAGIGIAAVGPVLVAMGMGAVSGGFLGAMMSRGFSKEAAQYYEQSVSDGKILVAVENRHGDPMRLALAERILADAGSTAVPLHGD